MQRIAVIDYGMGNLHSVSKAIEHVAPDDEVVVTDNESVIRAADRIVCPGQGAAADCMAAIHEHGLAALLNEIVTTRPFLGICMGYQVLFDHSEENGGVDCLGIVPGAVQRFANPLLADDSGERLKVPHMGWSEVSQAISHPLWQGIADKSRFYFAHSYYCVPEDAAGVSGYCNYGKQIAVSIARDSIFACQFHPEKSADNGLTLLKNFVRWSGDI
ncbi:MAG: imidazole glycerol phosphate synthase subunit HisH [Granulosicoccus sp.]